MYSCCDLCAMKVSKPDYLLEQTTQEVLTVPWDNRSSFVHDVTMYRIPVLVTDSPVTQWPAIKVSARGGWRSRE